MNPAYVGAKTGARGVEVVPRGTISRRAEDRVFKLFHVEQFERDSAPQLQSRALRMRAFGLSLCPEVDYVSKLFHVEQFEPGVG